MSRRYGERGNERYGGDDDERDYEARERREDDTYGDRYARGADYGAQPRGQSPGREYDYGRDYGYGRDSVSRDYGSRDYEPREYGPRRGHEGEEYTVERGRDYGREQGRDYGREHGRERSREHERDPNRVQSFDTDYGRTTSRFYGRSGYEYGRPNYGPEVTEYRSRRYDERGGHVDERDERVRQDRRDERGRGGRGWWDRAADGVLAWFGDDYAARRQRADGGRGGREIGNRERGDGLYRGRGPKNYRRPDERIREEINDRLTDNDWLDASDVEVAVVAGEVTLSGSVDSRYSKRLAEDIAHQQAKLDTAAAWRYCAKSAWTRAARTCRTPCACRTTRRARPRARRRLPRRRATRPRPRAT